MQQLHEDEEVAYPIAGGPVSYAPACITTFFPEDKFCLLCQFSSFDQHHDDLRDLLSQLEHKIKTVNMGIKYMAEGIMHMYTNEISRLLPESTPVWTFDSMMAHLSGRHGTLSIDAMKANDIKSMTPYIQFLDSFVVKVNTVTGEKTPALDVIALRIKLSTHLQSCKH